MASISTYSEIPYVLSAHKSQTQRATRGSFAPEWMEAFAPAAPKTAETASHSSSAPESDKEEDTKQAVIDEFLKFMAMSPAERLWLQFLKQEGLTQEDYEKLPLEQRIKIEAAIREKIELAMRQRLSKTDDDKAGGEPASQLLARRKELALDLYFAKRIGSERDKAPGMHEGDAAKIDAMVEVVTPTMHEGDAIKIDAMAQR